MTTLDRLPEQERFDCARDTIDSTLTRLTGRLVSGGFPNGRVSLVIGPGLLAGIGVDAEFLAFNQTIYCVSIERAEAEIDRLIFDRQECAA